MYNIVGLKGGVERLGTEFIDIRDGSGWSKAYFPQEQVTNSGDAFVQILADERFKMEE